MKRIWANSFAMISSPLLEPSIIVRRGASLARAAGIGQLAIVSLYAVCQPQAPEP